MFKTNFKASRLILAALAALALLLTTVQPADATPNTPTAGWHNSINSSSDSRVDDVVTDDSGNVYTASYFRGDYPGHLDPNPNSGINLLLAKYDSNGNELWFKIFATDFSQVGGIALDAAGNLYFSGYFTNFMTVDGTTYPSVLNQSNDSFLMKLSQTGSIIWFKHISDEDGATFKLAVDSAGNAYVLKYFRGLNAAGQAGIDGINWYSSDNAGSVLDGLVLLKFDTNGIVRRATVMPPNIWTFAIGGATIAVSVTGRVLIGGFVYQTTQFGSYGPFVINQTLNPFWMELDPTGEIASFNFYQAADQSLVTGVSYDQAENVYISGEFSNAIQIGSTSITTVEHTIGMFVAKFAANSSTPSWVNSFSGSGNQTAPGIAVDPAGNVTFALEMQRDSILKDYPVQGQDTTVPMGSTVTASLVIGLNGDGSTAWYLRVDGSGSATPVPTTRPALFDGGLYFGGDESIAGNYSGFVQKISFTFSNTTPMEPVYNFDPPAQTVRPLPAIQVGSISPRVLDAAAGGTVTVTASNASKVTSVKLGNVSLPFKILSTDQFQVTLPAHEVGYADLTFTTSEGKVPLSNAVRYSDVLNTHLAVITLVNPTRAALAAAKARFVKITFTDRVVTNGKKAKVTITLTGRIKN